MFAAKTSEREIKEEREDQEFQCPECKEKVMMKIGTQRMEHFAHQKGSLCVESYERESEYHLEWEAPIISMVRIKAIVRN